jgi:6-phosphogluconolactonase (cycloisomerase 2 family)
MKIRSAVVASVAAALSSVALAQPFQIVTTIAPPFSIPKPQWRDVLRFSLPDSGGAFSSLTNLPNGTVNDPVGVAFRTPTDLFIGNRHGNGVEPGTISRFQLTNNGATATFANSYTQPGLVGVHEICFNPVTKELFAAAVFDGIWRWKVDTLGIVDPNGSFARSRPWRGVCVEATGNYLFASAASGTIFRFRINEDGSMTELASQNLIGASNLHFFSLAPQQSEIYVADISAGKVFRLRVNADGSLTQLQTITSTNAIDCAFSPDGQEMFVAKHVTGGIDRFNYNPGTDTWVYSSTVPTDSLGGFATYVPAICPADLTGEGFVDDSDFQVFAQAYNILDCADGSMPLGCPADFNIDGFVDDNDFVIFVIAYNELVCS